MTGDFAFVEDGSVASIRFRGEPVLLLRSENCYYASEFECLDQCFEPGRGPEVNRLPLFALHGHRHPAVRLRYEAETGSDHLILRVIPVMTRGGSGVLEQVQEVCTFIVSREDGRLVWRQEMEVAVKRDLELASFQPDGPVRAFRFPHQDGRLGVFLQFADPQPVGASGPAVAMSRDWTCQPEPSAGADTFRRAWRRRYTGIIFEDPDGGFSRSELNKSKWMHLIRDNRMARPCAARGRLLLLKEDGSGLEYTVEAPTHFHHVCEWGMDYHFWLDLEPFAVEGVVPAGTVIRAATTARLVPPEATANLRRSARPIELTAAERSRADLPAYEEPESAFTVGVLDRIDAHPWLPTSEGCSWHRTGGHRPGVGRLEIRNRISATGSWMQPRLGPQNWCNPFLPGIRYRLSAWVLIEDLEWDADAAGPQVGVEWVYGNGSWPVAVKTTVHAGWSAPVHSIRGAWPPSASGWTAIELVTPPCPGNVQVARLFLRFEGRGVASFSGVRWETIDPM